MLEKTNEVLDVEGRRRLASSLTERHDDDDHTYLVVEHDDDDGDIDFEQAAWGRMDKKQPPCW